MGSSTHSTITLKGSASPFSYKAAGFPLFNRLSTFDLHYIHHHRTFTRTTPPQHHHHGRPPNMDDTSSVPSSPELQSSGSSASLASLESPLSPPIESNVADSFVFAFDIDGVLVRGGKPIPEALEAMKVLNGENEYGVQIPHIFLTTAVVRPKRSAAATSPVNC